MMLVIQMQTFPDSHGRKPADKMENKFYEVTVPTETSTDIKMYSLRSW